MEPGRELDLLIAEKFFGLCLKDRFTGEERPITAAIAIQRLDLLQSIPYYSTSISDAWMVAKEMQSLKQWGTLRLKFIDYRKEWSVGWEWSDMGSSSVDHESFSTSIEHAICLAALKAVGDGSNGGKG